MDDIPGRRPWRLRRRSGRGGRGPAHATRATAVPVPGEAGGRSLAAALQLAIGLLTAGLDSPDMEAWAVEEMIPRDAVGLGDFMTGLHILTGLLLEELHGATGQPPAAILQQLAIWAETHGGTPFTG
jgi:hypothetical protein